jgi:ribose transport system substrate-binding protein
MTKQHHWRIWPALACLALVLAACSGSSDDKASTSGTSGSGKDMQAAAQAAIQPFIDKPSPFPVTEPLNGVPPGLEVAYMECGTPICGLFGTLLDGAAKTMGVTLKRVSTGQTADTIGAAFDSVVQQAPDGVIVPGINIELWNKQLEKLQAAKIPIATTGIIDAADHGIVSPQGAIPNSERGGKILADFVAANYAPKANVVVYVIPELPFSAVISHAFDDELKTMCPGCSVRTEEIAVTTIGTTAPNTVVSDVQSHPDTTVAVFTSDEAQTGLPSALTTAGIDIKTLGYAPGPVNLQYLKDGQEAAALGLDAPVLMWTMLDQIVRQINGQKLTGAQAEGLAVVQMLQPTNITGDPSRGWTGYPDFAKRFAALWHVKG